MDVARLEWFYSFLGLKGSLFVSSVHTNTTLLGFFDILDLSHFNFLPSIVTKKLFLIIVIFACSVSINAYSIW